MLRARNDSGENENSIRVISQRVEIGSMSVDWETDSFVVMHQEGRRGLPLLNKITAV